MRKIILLGMIAAGVFGSLGAAGNAAEQKKLYNDCSMGKGPVCVQIPEIEVNGKMVDVKLYHLNGGKNGALTLKLYRISSGFPRVEGEKKGVQVLSLVSTTKNISMGPLEEGGYQLELFWTNDEMRVQGHARTFEVTNQVLQAVPSVVQPTTDPELQKLKTKLKAQGDEQKALALKLKELEDKKNSNPVIVTIPPSTRTESPWWEKIDLSKEVSVAPAADIRGTIPFQNLFGSNFISVFGGIGGKIMVSDVVTLRLLGGGRYNYGYFGGYGLVPAGAAEMQITPLDGILKFTARGEIYSAFFGVKGEGFGGISVQPYKPLPIRLGAYGLVNPDSWMIGAGPELDYQLGVVNFNLKGVFGVSQTNQFSGLVWAEIKY